MAKPYVMIVVDWDGDDVWEEANEDISADVRRVTLRQGKNIDKHRAEAAMLELLLKNDDHKYSPSLTTSVVYPYTLPGPDLWMVVSYPLDQFTASNGTTLASRKPTYDDTFAAWAGDTGQFDIQSNVLNPKSTGNYTAVLEFAESDCYVGCKYTRGGTTSGLICRWSNASNYLLVYHDGTNLRLGKVDAGTLSSIASATFAWTAGDAKRMFDDMERWGQHLVYRSAPVGSSSNNMDDILGVILDAVDFDSSNRILDTGTNVAANADHEKNLGRNALVEAYQAQDDDVGFMQVDGQGYARYEGASTGATDKTDDHRERAPHNAIVRVWRADRSAGDETDIEIGQHFKWDDGMRWVENEVYYVYHRISKTTGVKVYSLQNDDRPKIVNGKALELLAIGDEDHIANPRPPKHTTDFLLNSAEDGTGTDLLIAEDTQTAGTVTLSGAAAYTIDDTSQNFNAGGSVDWNDGNHVIWITDNGSDFAYAFIGTDDPDGNGTKVSLYTTHARATLGYAYTSSGFSESDTPLTYNVYNVWVELVTGFDGNFRQIKIHNGSGTDGFITKLLLLADKGVASSKTAARAEDAQSQTDYGRRRIEHATLHHDRYGDMGSDGFPDRTNDPGSAVERADKRVQLRKLAQERLRQVKMWNLTRANLMQIVHRSVSDRVNLVYPSMGIDDTYFIEYRKVVISEGGLKIDCEWDLVQTFDGNVSHARLGQFIAGG